MKEKILSQLVQKYPGVSKKFLGLWADKLAPKVTEENEIEGVINELDNLPISVTDLAAEWQKEGDARVIDAKKEWVKNPPKPDKPIKTDPTPTTPEPQQDDTPAWAKALIEQNKALAEKVAGIEKEKTVGSIKQKATEKLKDIPASYWAKRPLPDKEEELESFITDVTTDYDAFKQDMVNQGLAIQTKPAGANGGANNKASKEEVKGILDKIMSK